MMNNGNLLERIRKIDKLTRSETKIVSYFEKNYPFTVFETISSLSEKASVGKATLSRFIQRLGYKNFPEFMKSMQKEMLLRLDSPIKRYTKKKASVSPNMEDQLELHVSSTISNLEETLQRIDNKEFCQAAEILATSKGRLFITGAATSQALANYFHLLASYLRKDVYLIEPNVGTLAHALADVSKNDVLFAMTHQRFSVATINISRWFAKQEAQIVLLSDREVTPISPYATIQLVSCANAPLLFSSRTASFVLLEALISAMTTILDRQVQDRFDQFDNFFDDFKTFYPKSTQK